MCASGYFNNYYYDTYYIFPDYEIELILEFWGIKSLCVRNLYNIFTSLWGTGQKKGVATHHPLRQEILEQQASVWTEGILLYI
jgi:hypothetical protein